MRILCGIFLELGFCFLPQACMLQRKQKPNVYLHLKKKHGKRERRKRRMRAVFRADASSLQSRCEQSSKPMRAIFRADASDLQSRCEQSSEPMRKYIHLTLVRILQSRTILAKDSAAFLENRDMIFYFRPSRRQKSETALGQEPKSLSSRYGLPAPRVSG